MVPRRYNSAHLAVTMLASLLATGQGFAQQTKTAEIDSQIIYSFNRQNVNEPVSQAIETESAIAETINQTVPQTLPPAPLPGPVMHHDRAVVPASQLETEVETSKPDKRRLAPPSKHVDNPTEFGERESRPGSLPFKVPNLDALGTAGAGLALVVGLFLLCVSLVRKGKPNASTPLPTDVVAVLGRVPLAGRHFANLIQVGSKLVLVAITPDSIQTITEVTEPAEVERLLGLCMKSNARSSSVEFQRILQQMSKEPARGFLGK